VYVFKRSNVSISNNYNENVYIRINPNFFFTFEVQSFDDEIKNVKSLFVCKSIICAWCGFSLRTCSIA
jgi:hypothetical protein